MAAIAPSQLSTVRTSLPRPIVIAATAFVLAGALRFTTAIEQVGLDVAFPVLFVVVAAAQVAFGALLSIDVQRLRTTPVVVSAMVASLAFIALWLVATTATVPEYPLLNGPYPVDVMDASAAVLEAISIVALCKSLPQPTRRRVMWGMIILMAGAWLVWVVIISVAGLSD
ncbi:MAG TPA: hypothetical protein VFX16_30785 [Pseudonocardiaceae bacterium]|nr:hypothetical protein [Pseudonocardiaceae bacterium]